MTQHTLLVDGYNVGDRLLDGAMFKVLITEKDGTFTIDRVEVPDDRLRGVDYGYFFDDIRQQIQGNLDHLVKYAKGENKTLVQLFDEWERNEPDMNRIDLLNEV